MRDILAALLRSRGYTHDDERDPYDMHWYGPGLGVRPLLACVAFEMDRDADAPHGFSGWDTYSVSVGRPAPGAHEVVAQEPVSVAPTPIKFAPGKSW